MIEQRKLTRDELTQLILEAPDSEVRNMLKILGQIDMEPYDFFDEFAVDYFGLISDGRPIYVAVITKNDDDEMEFWTIVNSNISNKFSLCKYSKRELKLWRQKYKKIYATMEKGASEENKKWTEWLGFQKFSEDKDTITYAIGG